MSSTRGKALRLLIGSLALVGGLLAGAAAPAQAVVLDTDRPKITERGFDFGRNWDTFGAPLNGGHLYWDVTNGVVTPDLEGYLYLKNVASSCAKIQVIYHDASHGFLDLDESPLYCADTNAMEDHWINIDDYGSPFTTHVIVKLNVQNTNGTFTTVGQQTWYLG
jgi:hypothetical protein